MATYDYRCRECDESFEVRRSVLGESAAVECPEGHVDVVRVWSAVSVVGSSPAGVAAPAAAGGGCCGGGCCS